MKLLFQRVESRLNEFVKFLYETQKHVQQIAIASEPIADPFDFSEKGGNWQPFSIGSSWPAFELYFWLHIPITIPAEWSGKEVELIVLLSKDYTLHTPEGLAYVNGTLRHGLDRNHHTLLLTNSAEPNEVFNVAIRVYSGEPLQYITQNSLCSYQLSDCSIAVPNAHAKEFYFLAKSVFDVLSTFSKESRLRYELLEMVGECFQRIDYKHPFSSQFYESIQHALDFLKKEIQSIDIFPSRIQVTGTGHAHIDIAWLWPIKRTREKAIQTFSTVLELMEHYPEYRFFQSQPQLYQFVKEDHPELYERIRQRIKDGRWEADGGMWVEGDCNVTSGESIVRQFLYGSQFFENELDSVCSILWLPDVFGYSGQLPQIMQKAEISYFMTTKISWNQYNQMPYDSFRWRGIDGTEILAHFVTTPTEHWFKTYNALLTPEEIKGAWDAYHQKDIHNEILIVFGHGDGGGGPTEEMLLTAKHIKNLPGFPTVQQGPVRDFFYRLGKIRKNAPVWEGELYLEYHRGTYTSQARNKRLNREAEFRMQQTEWMASIASLYGFEYPREQLQTIWKKILLNQFHDILPGSSIHKVYEESERDYGWIQKETDQIIESAKSNLTRASNAASSLIFTFINTLGWCRLEPYRIPDIGITNAVSMQLDGREAVFQPIQFINGNRMIVVDGLPLNSFSLTTVAFEPHEKKFSPLETSSTSLKNEWLQIQLNQQGEIASLYDKEFDREILNSGEPANVFQVFEDKPIDHDAWDIDIFYQDKLLSTGEAATMEIIEEGPLRATLKVTKTILDGTIEQHISIYRSSRRIDFDTKIEWSNKDVLLKVSFPVAIHANRATYDIQFGNIQRPTHWNTSWDWARFETWAHKWVDLSEGDYGVSLMNDCKYGHDIRGHTIRMTLIKCASAPDPLADVGTHYFAYSLYPHAGDWREAYIPQRAYEFNVDPLVFPGEVNPSIIGSSTPFAKVDCDHVLLETVKISEDENAFVLRLFECYNQRGPVQLQFFQPLKKATECNLLERDEREVEWNENVLSFFIKPYEVRTFKVWF